MPDFTVSRYGTDSSGRGIYASAYMWSWWQGVLADLDFRPTITQGAWMTLNGGGADDSAGYHDGGGCFDLRVWDLYQAQVAALVNTIRNHGAAAWLRNEVHGGFTDDHIHLVLGTDHDLDDGAAYQWRDYINGGDGMGGHDYHPRPNPLITEPPEDDMPFTEAELTAIVEKAATKAVDALLDEEQANGKSLRENIRIGANARDLAREVVALLDGRSKG